MRLYNHMFGISEKLNFYLVASIALVLHFRY